MMAPHPNYPTLEFASIGTVVVTTKYANKIDLGTYAKNIVMSDINAESMAGAINMAAQMAAKNIPVKTTIPTEWQATIDKPLQTVLKNL
jgi:hypothetical protein